MTVVTTATSIVLYVHVRKLVCSAGRRMLERGLVAMSGMMRGL